MSAHTHTIKVNAETAETLSRQAAERGLTVSELVAELALVAASESDMAELDRRWKAIESGEDKTIPHEDVVEWLRTWGTDEFRPRIAR
jgi:predicted transcriptional regulator